MSKLEAETGCDKLNNMQFPGKTALVAACFLSASASSPARPNLILISVDTLRQDHLSVYGYHRQTTANIDRLLESGVRFNNAHCNVPLTNPSFASLYTSAYPHDTGATRNGVPMVKSAETLAEILKRNGYSTAAFLSNWPLKARISNLDKGFDLYDDNFFKKRWVFFNNERGAKQVTELANRWLDSRPREPFFLWAHYSDPHAPYLLHRGFAFPSPKGPRSEAQDRADAYDSEVAYTDHYIGELLDKIKALGMDRHSLIVFTADHGEELGEHGYIGHGRHVYEPSMRIPFGVSGPGIPSGVKVDAQVELLDLAPTMLAYASLPRAKAMKGRNILPYVQGLKSWPARFLIYYETYPGAVRVEAAEKLVDINRPSWIGLKIDDLKVSCHLSGSRWEMYNLQADPGENKNLAEPTKGVFIEFSNLLMAWYKGWRSSAVAGRTDAMSEEDRKRLESLGYFK